MQKIIYKLLKLNSLKDLFSIIHKAKDAGIITNEGINLVKASLNLHKIEVHDIMVVKNDISFIEKDASYSDIINIFSETSHSRFPIINKIDNSIIGIFHVKDLLFYPVDYKVFNLEDYIRPVVFVPEYKKLDKLLMEMQVKKSHMCVVVDEFTNVIGVVTLEMILELIVGDIDDEYDLNDKSSDVLRVDTNIYRVKGSVSIKKLQNQLNISFPPDIVNNLGSYVIKVNNGMPDIKQIVKIDDKLSVEIISATTKHIELVNLIIS